MMVARRQLNCTDCLRMAQLLVPTSFFVHPFTGRARSPMVTGALPPPSVQGCQIFACAGNDSAAAPERPLVDRITSPSNPYIKHCVRLRTNSDYRKKMGRVLLVGSVLLRELMGTRCDCICDLMARLGAFLSFLFVEVSSWFECYSVPLFLSQCSLPFAFVIRVFASFYYRLSV